MSRPRILIVEARFYDHIADGLLDGATAALAEAGAEVVRLTVPGVLEIPATVSLVLAAATQDPGQRFDGFVVLGCVIRGESDHYDHVCRESMRALQDLAVQYHLAVGNGILTVHNEAQALDRAKPERKNIGGLAARACLRMISIKRELFHLS